MQMNINQGKTNYFPNSLGGGCPMMSPETMGGFVHYAQKVEGQVIRDRSESFSDHFSQATLFWNSMSKTEKEHLVEAAHFELGKVESKEVRERMVDLFNHVDHELAKLVAMGIGVPTPTQAVGENHGRSSAALSMENTVKDTVKSRHIAILAADGFDSSQLMEMKQALKNAGALAQIVSKFKGMIKSADGQEVEVDKTFLTSASVMYDAVYVPGGKQSIQTLSIQGDAIHFINEAFKHCKAIAATGEGVDLLSKSEIKGVALAEGQVKSDKGVVTDRDASDINSVAQEFIQAIAQHRNWTREEKEMVPA